MQLKNAVVLITGGSRGLGQALAETFVQAGSQVVITAKNQELLNQVAKGIGALSLLLDVRSESQVEAAVQKVIERFGRIDIWVNNAGIWLPHVPIEKMDLSRVHDMVEVNLFGTIYGSKIALQQMRKQSGGVIVNILSTSALTGRAYGSGYCASKYAAVGFTSSLRLEVEADNIKVIAVYPGGMKTSFFDEAKPENYDEYMEPAEVARKIVDNLAGPNPELELIIKRPA